MKKTSLKEVVLSSVVTLVFPMLAMAATFDTILNNVKGWLNTIIALLFILVTLYFIWGVVEYVKAGGDDNEVKKGKTHMIWGIIGMAVMAAAWGIVKVLVDSFGVGGGSIPTTGM